MRLPLAAVLAVALAGACGSRASADDGGVLTIHVRPGEPARYTLVMRAGGTCRGGLPEVTEVPLDATTFEQRRHAAGSVRTVVFVPGFNTSLRSDFASVGRVAARLGRSDRFVLIEWGSAGRLDAYDHDAHLARGVAPGVAHELLALKRAAPATEIDVFAHSLGTRIVAMAIPSLPAGHSVVENTVLAAPDMTVADYTRAIARIPGPIDHITLYTSRHDRALLLSEVIHLHRRLGQITDWNRMLANTEVIDASLVSHSLGHNYATTEPLLIDDIGATLAGAAVPHADWHAQKHVGAPVWQFAPPGGAPAVAAAESTCVTARSDPPTSAAYRQ